MRKFEIKENFMLDGEPFHVISAGIHYFRIVPEYWQDRLEKAKAVGCNTIETYLPWNMHEPVKGQFCFDGILDVVRFVKTAESLGLYVILRPSPYICAEWEFGGMPAWLLAEEGMRFRTFYEPFMQHVDDYYKELMKHLAPLQIDQGGPVIMMQVENEYGSYGNDKLYLAGLRDMMIKYGVTVPLVTSDGPLKYMLDGGTISGVHPTANFGSLPEERFPILNDYTDGPHMCMEFWIGWFDHWGNEKHADVPPAKNKGCLDKMLELGHLNFYMFHGGTNFGFMNGSNYHEKLGNTTTSYDYDGVIGEAGEMGEKFHQYKEIIAKYRDIPEVTFSTDIKQKAYGKLTVKEKVGLFESLDLLSGAPTETAYPQSMEVLGQSYGYILYRSVLADENHLEKFRLYEANDRAQVYLNNQLISTLYDKELLDETLVDHSFDPGAQLDILVENTGRVNYGLRLERQRKGINQQIQINGRLHFGWQHFNLPLDNIEKLDFTRGHELSKPGFYRFTFEVDETGDTYLDFTGWGKGVAYLNGFNLGRFWEIGPQQRLYIPGPLLKVGENEIILFESEGKTTDFITLAKEPKFN